MNETYVQAEKYRLDESRDAISLLIIAGAGFSATAGFPVTRSIWDAATPEQCVALSRQADGGPRVKDLIEWADAILRGELNLIQKPLTALDAEEVWDLVQSMVPRSGPYLFMNTNLVEPRVKMLRFAYECLHQVYFEVLGRPYEDLVAEYRDESAPAPWLWEPPEVYRRFCSLLPKGTHLLTTNYDDLAELALLDAGRNWNYGCVVGYSDEVERRGYRRNAGTFHVWVGSMERPPGLIWSRLDWRPPASDRNADILLYKLHGSLRWIQCRDCNNTYAVDFWAAAATFFCPDIPLTEDIRFRCWDAECCWTPYAPILPPVTSKRLQNFVIRSLWAAAFQVARRCTDLTIIGSALRPSDALLLRLAGIAASRARTVRVVDPSDVTAARIRNILRRDVIRHRSLEEYVDFLGSVSPP